MVHYYNFHLFLHHLYNFLPSTKVFLFNLGRYRLDQQHIANKDKKKRLGDILRDKVGPLNIVVCFRAEDLQEILRNEGTYPYRVAFTTIKAYRATRKQWYSTSGLLSV